ncbi:MAG: hypothetical protein NZT92_03460 [Abditibacteriales bacterium]|nr:hypothetical protein [Abditibacteriales bacterium]MDW8365870.1 hypothetical protein [Abditibacteriales bacterium]
MMCPFDRADPRYARWALRRAAQLRRLALALKPPQFSPERIAELYRPKEPQKTRLAHEGTPMCAEVSGK